MSGCSRIRSTAALSPCTTFRTPAGTPACAARSAISNEADGSFSDGFSTNVLPRGDGVRQHPQRHHRRKVERRDAGHDTEGLADRVDVDSRRRLLGELALQQLRDAAGELDVLDPACHLAERVGVHLAVLGGDGRRELLAVAVEQVAEPEQHLGPARQRRRPPAGERGLRRRHRGVELVGRGEIDHGCLLTGRGVVDRTVAARGSLDRATVDPVGDAFHGLPPLRISQARATELAERASISLTATGRCSCNDWRAASPMTRTARPSSPLISGARSRRTARRNDDHWSM